MSREKTPAPEDHDLPARAFCASAYGLATVFGAGNAASKTALQSGTEFSLPWPLFSTIAAMAMRGLSYGAKATNHACGSTLLASSAEPVFAGDCDVGQRDAFAGAFGDDGAHSLTNLLDITRVDADAFALDLRAFRFRCRVRRAPLSVDAGAHESRRWRSLPSRLPFAAASPKHRPDRCSY